MEEKTTDITTNELNSNNGNKAQCTNRKINKSVFIIFVIIIIIVVVTSIAICSYSPYEYKIEKYRLTTEDETYGVVDFQIKNHTNEEKAFSIYVRCYKQGTNELIGSGSGTVFVGAKETTTRSILVKAQYAPTLKNSYVKVEYFHDVSSMYC